MDYIEPNLELKADLILEQLFYYYHVIYCIMGFREKDDWPNTIYNSNINNIVTEFFIPALKDSTTYRRICGLFSSNSFALCARGIK